MPKLQQIGLEAVMRTTKFLTGVKTYNKGIKGMNESTKKGATGLKGLDKQFGSLKGGMLSILPSMAAVAGAGYAVKEAFEFGKEGAVIAQTKESFDRLMGSMGIAPDILRQMSAATLETVDNQTLMASTMTLLAGTSDKLGSAMANNAPQLLEIAKAANKLNPSLGDTAFLYNSLATGIKRSSPLVLDNLGLTIKVGEANAVMAAKLDKSVEALSAEEKQMALLEAALESGNRMIEQVGGSVEAMGDDFAQAEVRIKNATDTIKAQMAPVIADTVEGGLAAADTANQIATLTEAILAWAAAAVTGEDATAAFTKTMGVTEAIQQDYNATIEGSVLGIGELVYQTERLGIIQHETSITTEDLERAQKALDVAIKDIRKSYESFFGSLSKGIVSYRDLSKAQAQSATDYKKSIADLNKEAGKAYADVQDNFQASLPDPTTVQGRMSMAGDAWDEWALRIEDIIQNGVESPWYAALQEMGYSKPPDVGMTQWLEGLKEKFYAGQLPDLLPPEWAAKVKTQQEEATRVVQAENAKRLAAAKAAREEELAAEREARNQAMIELALAVAESTKQLETWSQERFGPDLAGSFDTAAEVLDALTAGVLDMDTELQSLLADSLAGVQETLTATEGLAQENQGIITDLVETDWAAEAQAQLERGLSLENIKQTFNASAEELGYSLEEQSVPEGLFDPLITNFEGASTAILGDAVTMGLGLGDEFGKIDLDWAAMVGSQVKSWDEGMTEVEKAIQEKVIEKLGEIPREIIISVTTQQENYEPQPEGKQHGGPVTGGTPYVVGEVGPEVFVPDQSGLIIPNYALNLPALDVTAGTAGASGSAPQINLTLNPVINTPMDLAEFEARTVQTVQRAIRGE